MCTLVYVKQILSHDLIYTFAFILLFVALSISYWFLKKYSVINFMVSFEISPWMTCIQSGIMKCRNSMFGH